MGSSSFSTELINIMVSQVDGEPADALAPVNEADNTLQTDASTAVAVPTPRAESTPLRQPGAALQQMQHFVVSIPTLRGVPSPPDLLRNFLAAGAHVTAVKTGGIPRALCIHENRVAGEDENAADNTVVPRVTG